MPHERSKDPEPAPKRPRETCVAVLVSQLPDETTAEDLAEHFQIYGRLEILFSAVVGALLSLLSQGKVLTARLRRRGAEREGLLTLSAEVTQDAMQLIRVLLEHSHSIHGEAVKVRTMLQGED